jgi:mRNA-degrading endonuclease RelE of RelBE toxin-antitoxin system
MDKISKFLQKLSLSERKLWLKILSDVMAQKFGGYDIKPLKGYAGVFRLRKGRIRLVYGIFENNVVVFNLDYRSNVYQDL